MSGSGHNDANNGSRSPKVLSRRKFLLGSAATAASAAVTVNSEYANAFFNTFGFMKRTAGNGQTSNGYTIGQSLRFTGASGSALSNYLSHSFSSASSVATKFTISLWCKRGRLGQNWDFLYAVDASGSIYSGLSFNGSDQLQFYSTTNGGSALAFEVQTTSLFRDLSAWYHVCAQVDSTVPSVKIWVNGVQQTLNTSIALSQNQTLQFCGSGSGYIGRNINGYSFDGYMAEFCSLPGQALDASSFGQIDSNTGQWIPKAYSGAYGTNGFYLEFADNSNTTAATLGKDSSPNGNNFTPNNFNAYDQVLDSPTNNFCTCNYLDNKGNGSVSAGGLLLNGGTSGGGNNLRSTIWASSGKWYAEFTQVSGSNTMVAGAGNEKMNPWNGNSSWPGAGDANGWGYYGLNTYQGIYNNGSNMGVGGAAYTNGDIVGLALDADAKTIAFYKNNVLQTTVTMTGSNFCFSVGSGQNYVCTANFGQGGQTGLTYDAASGGRFKYTPPAGFKALCSANIAAPVIKNPIQYFASTLFSGTGAGMAGSTSALAFAPDLVWWKDRNSTDGHNIYDSVRGAGKLLQSNSSGVESTNSQLLTAFNSNGFSWGASGTNSGINNYVAWSWKKGTMPGFDIVSYSGNNGVSMSVAHGLGTAPAFVLIKDRDYDYDWIVYHRALGATKDLRLNLTNASDTNDYWDNTAPTASVFRVGTNPNVNYSTQRYVAYLWAEVPGFSKFGSYTGNGSSDGPFVYCGFKPRFVLLKSTTTASTHWIVYDGIRNTYNLVNLMLNPSTNGAELVNGSYSIDLLSNGFKCRDVGGGLNASGEAMIFVAFAEAPFKYATAR